jgi:sulfite exporter TauE/SafE
MLASISPLGERARSSRWGVTVAAYLTGSVLGGAAVGLLASAVGSLLPQAWRGSSTALLLLAALLLTGLLLDRRTAGLHLPTWHRQVDERWLVRYRGWVYGVGFGVQLGLGVVTIVPSATVYATVVLCALSGSPAVGLAVGVLFGLARALPVLGLARTQDRAALHHSFRRLARWAPRADRLAQGALATGAAALVAAAVVGS